MKKISILLLCLNCVILAHAQQKKFNKPLTDSLARLVIVDQIAAKVPEGEYKKWPREKWERYKDSVFTVHQKILSNIFKQFGYPGYDLVGEKGSNNFWLMVQHCDKDPAFQQEILTAMKPQVLIKNAHAKNFAYLTDRVNINTGKKQVYGTQVTYNTDSCQAIPKPLADSANVNQRRYEVDLEPIEEYQNTMSQFHFDMNKENYEKKGITKPKLIPVPKKPAA